MSVDAAGEVIVSPAPSRAPSLAISGALTVVTNVIQAVGYFGAMAIAARALGPEAKGVYDLYATTAALLATALGMSLPAGLTWVVASRGVNVRRLTCVLIAIAMVTGIVATGVVMFGSRFYWVAKALPQAPGGFGIAVIGAMVAGTAASSMFRAVVAGQQRFAQANAVDVFKQAAVIALMAVAILQPGRSRLNAFLAAITVATALSAVGYALMVERTQTQAATSGIRASFVYGVPCHVATVVQFLNYRLDVFIVSAIAGTLQLGLYQTAVFLCQGINLLPVAAQAVLFPTVSNSQDPRLSIQRTVQANRLMMACSVTIALVLVATGPFAIPLVFGRAFAGSVRALLLLAPGCVAFATANVVAAYFGGIGKPRLNLYASLAGVAVTLPLDLLLIPRWGIAGAAVASTISYATTAVVTALLFCRMTATPLAALLIPTTEDFATLIARLRRRSAPAGGAAQ